MRFSLLSGLQFGHGLPGAQSQASARLLSPPHGLSGWASQIH